jgi:hypothetical protein
MEEFIKQSNKARYGVKKYLFEHINEFVFQEVDSHYVVYTLGDYRVTIWTTNGEDYCRFYDEVEYIDLFDLEYTKEESALLWNMAQESKSQKGEKRSIKMDQIRNDLFFSFKGVYGTIKFTGYNDQNWWDNHAPTAITEVEGSIVWSIDLKTMVATYKPTQK